MEANPDAVAEIQDPGHTSAPRTRRVVTRRTAVTAALGLATLIVVLDQVTKAVVTARIGGCGNPNFYPVFGTHAGFSYICNSGTAFSRFSGSSLVWLPVGFAALVVGWLWYRSLEEPRLLQQVAFGLILGGASGNLIDRARLGYVVDFVDLRLTQSLRWYVFNVSDAAITFGVIALALAFWFLPDPPPKPHTTQVTATPSVE